MAKVIESSTGITLELSLLEKIFGFKSGISVDKDLLIKRYTVNNPWSREVIKGIRAPGAAVPYLVLLGTMRYRGGKDFTAIYKRGPVEIFEFKDSQFDRWIISR
jgi:hypothetical protein